MKRCARAIPCYVLSPRKVWRSPDRLSIFETVWQRYLTNGSITRQGRVMWSHHEQNTTEKVAWLLSAADLLAKRGMNGDDALLDSYVSLCVLAGIAASDVVCCAHGYAPFGQRPRGRDCNFFKRVSFSRSPPRCARPDEDASGLERNAVFQG